MFPTTPSGTPWCRRWPRRRHGRRLGAPPLMLKAGRPKARVQRTIRVEQTFPGRRGPITRISLYRGDRRERHHTLSAGKAPEGGEAYFRRPETLARLERAAVTGEFTRVGSQYIVTVPIIAPDRPGLLHIGIDVGFRRQNRSGDVVRRTGDTDRRAVLHFRIAQLHRRFRPRGGIEIGLNGVLDRAGRGDFTMTTIQKSDEAFGGVRRVAEKMPMNPHQC